MLEFLGELRGAEEKLKRLTRGRDPPGQCIERYPLWPAKQLGIHGKIERYACSSRQLGNIAKRRHAGLSCEIWRHPQPGEKRGQLWIEAARLESPSQGLPFEIN